MAGNLIVDYASLETAITDWLAKSSYTDSNYLPEIIRAAEDRIYNGHVDDRGTNVPGLRIRQMEKSLPGGGITSFTIVGGTLYAATDTVAFSAPPAGGIQATGTLVVDSTTGAITGVTLTNPGLGYTSAPTATITTSTGSGATITPAISASAAVSLSSNMAVPSDYLELKYCVLSSGSGTRRMERRDAGWLYQNYPDAGAIGFPSYIGRDGSVFIFKQSTDAAYGASGIYYSRAAPLSGTNTTNWIVNANTINFNSLMLAACLAEGFRFARDDDNASFWENRWMNLMRQIQKSDERERVSGSPLRMIAG